MRLVNETQVGDNTEKRHQAFPQASRENFSTISESGPTHWILQMSEKKFLLTSRAPANTPAGTLSVDKLVELSEKQARRSPAAVGSNRHCPLILLAENREPVRVALKKILDEGY